MLPWVQAIALYPCLSLCVFLCVCLSVTSRCSVKRDESGFFALRLSSTSPTLCLKEIQVSREPRVLSSETFSSTPDLVASPRHIDRRTCHKLSSRKVDV